MYEATFSIEFPKISFLSQSIDIRHDLVHRNGRSKNNEVLQITEETISNLLCEVVSFVNDLTKELKKTI